MKYTAEYILSVRGEFAGQVYPGLEDFLDEYEEIRRIDRNVTLFSQTRRFGSITNQYQRGEGAWTPFTATNRHDRTVKEVVDTFNKITEDNLERLLPSLFGAIENYGQLDIFQVISRELIKKIVINSNYYDVYITLCEHIWKNKHLVATLARVQESWGKWQYTNEQGEVVGGFKSDREAIEAAYREMNYKKYLLQVLQKVFEDRDKHLANAREATDDEVRFRERHHLFGLVEFVGKLFVHGDVSERIVHVCLVQLLRVERPPAPSADYVEAACKMWQVVEGHVASGLRKQYVEYVRNSIYTLEWTNRIRFMLEDMMGMDPPPPGLEGGPEPGAAPGTKPEIDYDGVETVISEYLKHKKVQHVREQLEGAKIEDVSLVIIYLGLEGGKRTKTRNGLLAKLWKTMDCDEYRETALAEIRENMDDIKIDVPDAEERLDVFMKEL